MMNAVENITSHYLADYENSASALPGRHLPWLQQLCSDALQQFAQHGFPSPREEEWKYTNVSAIEKKRFSPAASEAAQAAVDSDWLDACRLADAWSLVLVDGRFSAQLSRLEGLPESVIVCGMAEALEKHPDRLEVRFGRALTRENHGFIHFTSAWFSDGLYLHIPPRTVLDKPVQLLHVVTKPDSLAVTHSLIDVESMAEAEVFETFVGVDDLAYLNASVTEVLVGDNARLDLYKLQCETGKAYHFGGTYVLQESHGRFQHHNFSFGGLLARNEVHTDLGRAAECQLNGLYIGTRRQHCDNHTRINHTQPYGISREMYKGILDQRARGVFQGRVVVFEGAQKTDSEMNNRNLLLSNDAEADTKPQLEIYNDDVKCSHGVTVGQLDEKSIFYLRSRCIDAETARNMLTFAFANEMVDKLPNRSFQGLVQERLLAHFPQTGIVKEWL